MAICNSRVCARRRTWDWSPPWGSIVRVLLLLGTYAVLPSRGVAFLGGAALLVAYTAVALVM